MRIMKCSILIFIFLVPLLSAAQEMPPAQQGFTVAFYNVENLFDTTDDQGEGDDEYLPLSAKQWDNKKYNRKLGGIAGALGSLNKNELPGLIGLAEVENRRVLDDLVRESPLRGGKYQVAHFDSPDERGIDVALLYRPDEFTVTESRPIPVTFTFAPDDRTRDMLYVKGVADDGNQYHVYVCHWPSRSGNERESEMRRIVAAAELRKDIDNILNFENDARIIVMGDFNDEPTNRSLMQILNATNKRLNYTYRDLYNLMYDSHNTGASGTIAWNGAWQMFDQIIVSFSLLRNSGGYYTLFEGGRVHSSDDLLQVDSQTGFRSPGRTYSGDIWNEGVSDHLPVFVVFRKDDPR
jgi:endonuclease/exonuclease/phosphatase family metal-dependent hydrolase